MPEMTSYAPGTPSWVDLGSPDPAAAARFYGELFGWTHEDAGPDAGGYGFFLLDGRQVGGVGPLQDPRQPPAWASYVTVEDVDATAAAFRDAGGQVVSGPMDLPAESGRMAVFADTTGAVICGFQPRNHKGAQVVNEPGSFCWTEHVSREPEQAQELYAAVFGWEFRKSDNPYADYWTAHAGGAERGIAGMIRMTDAWPPEVPAHWMAYFAVEDTDAAAARVRELGGEVRVEPFEIPAGRIAVCADPHGAAFSVIKLNPDFAG
jgi:predicted enzyme related to lactoylglutathione lyase